MHTLRKFAAAVIAVLLMVAPARAEVIGAATSGSDGAGAIRIDIAPHGDSVAVREKILTEVRLREEGSGVTRARIRDVTVENRVLTIEFVNAEPDVLVEALLDDEVAAWLKGATGISRLGGLALGVGAVAVGVTLGGLGAAGAFDGGSGGSPITTSPSQ